MGDEITPGQESRISDTAACVTKGMPARRILLAEDNPVNRELATEMLTFLGFHVDLAEDGREAVAASGRCAYDLILMDCEMPVLDGYEATRRIRAAETACNRKKAPIVALTGYDTAEDRDKCLEAGMDDFLGKPFSLNEIREMTGKWVTGDGC
jgi:CheY-like chemotaxis protein